MTEMTRPEPLHIVIAGDRRVLPGLEAVVFSTMRHNTDVVWHLFTMDVQVDHADGTGTGYYGITEEDAAWLRKIVKFMDHHSDFIRHDVRADYDARLAESVNRETGFTPYTSLRLLADKVLDVDRCLYLDDDVIVQGDLRPPYEQYGRADCDYAAYTLPGACDGFGEMIAAVLVFNLAHIRRSGFLDRARRYYNQNLYRYPDQMALRDAGDPEPLEETYNYMQDHKLAACKPVVLHFSNGNRYKLYTTAPGSFYRYYPEHKYIKDGLDIIRSAH